MLICFDIDENSNITNVYGGCPECGMIKVEVSEELANNMLNNTVPFFFRYVNDEIIVNTNAVKIHEKRTRITRIKQKLDETDYYTSRIMEAQINDETPEKKYLDGVEYRKRLRNEMNELENEIIELNKNMRS